MPKVLVSMIISTRAGAHRVFDAGTGQDIIRAGSGRKLRGGSNTCHPSSCMHAGR